MKCIRTILESPTSDEVFIKLLLVGDHQHRNLWPLKWAYREEKWSWKCELYLWRFEEVTVKCGIVMDSFGHAVHTHAHTHIYMCTYIDILISNLIKNLSIWTNFECKTKINYDHWIDPVASLIMFKYPQMKQHVASGSRALLCAVLPRSGARWCCCSFVMINLQFKSQFRCNYKSLP